eukprot:scaffold334_cov241-Pinguiococcus_pyrenoidosus.AAC.66
MDAIPPDAATVAADPEGILRKLCGGGRRCQSRRTRARLRGRLLQQHGALWRALRHHQAAADGSRGQRPQGLSTGGERGGTGGEAEGRREQLPARAQHAVCDARAGRAVRRPGADDPSLPQSAGQPESSHDGNDGIGALATQVPCASLAEIQTVSRSTSSKTSKLSCFPSMQGPLTTVIATNSESMLPYLDTVFEVMRAAQKTSNATLDSVLASVCLLAGSAPDKFIDNLDVLLAKLDTIYGASILNAFWNIAKVKPEPFVPHIGKLVGLLRDPSLFMALYVLGEVALSHAREVEDAGLDGILSTISVWVGLGPQAPTFFAGNVFGAIGKANPASRDKMLQILGEMLAMDAVKSHDTGAMSVIDNMKALCLDTPGDLEDYLDDIRVVKEKGGGHASATAAEALALYEGTSRCPARPARGEAKELTRRLATRKRRGGAARARGQPRGGCRRAERASRGPERG